MNVTRGTVRITTPARRFSTSPTSGTTPGGLGSIYQIDAAGFGGTANTAAVVESTFLVQSSVKDLGGL